MAKMTMVQAINLALSQEMEKDNRVVLLGEDVGKDEGVFRVSSDLYKYFEIQQFFRRPQCKK